MKIREQIKDWKNIHAERVTVEKKFFKKRKKNQKMWSEKEKKWKKTKKKKNDGQYEHFLFLFQWLFKLGTDVWFLLYYLVEIVLLKILLLSSTWGGTAQ